MGAWVLNCVEVALSVALSNVLFRVAMIHLFLIHADGKIVHYLFLTLKSRNFSDNGSLLRNSCARSAVIIDISATSAISR